MAPDTVTVGQPYRAVARIIVPAGSRVEVALVPADSEAVEARGGVAVDTTAAARGQLTATVALAAWKTGAGTPVDAVLRVTSPAGATREVAFPFIAPFVRSVLPKDTTNLKPKGPKDVMDAVWRGERNVRLAALGGLLFALVLGVVYLLMRLFRGRRRRGEIGDPRERAAAALADLGASGMAERGDWRGFYCGVSDAMRELAAALSPEWGTDLTTAELVARMEDDDVPGADVADARAVLDRADVVKFARHQPSIETANADLATARAWVARVQPPVTADTGVADSGETREMAEAGSAP
ncbi:MAG: hypothetical protein JWM27_4783 [Gemmatimonadetes bacterium]|nr:hypothetical protein [Gemmatimonadota bacterium]